MHLITLLVLIFSGSLGVRARDLTDTEEMPRMKFTGSRIPLGQITKSSSNYYPLEIFTTPAKLSTVADALLEGDTGYASEFYSLETVYPYARREQEGTGRDNEALLAHGFEGLGISDDEFTTLEQYYPHKTPGELQEDSLYHRAEAWSRSQGQPPVDKSQYEGENVPQTGDAPQVPKLPRELLKQFVEAQESPLPKESRGAPRKLDVNKVTQFLNDDTQEEAPGQAEERKKAFQDRIKAFKKEFDKIRKVSDELPEVEQQGAAKGRVKRSVLDRLKGNLKEVEEAKEPSNFVELKRPKTHCPSEINPETAKRVIEEALAKATASSAGTSSAEIKRIYRLYYPCLFEKEVQNEVRLAMINNLRQLRIISLELFGTALRSKKLLCRKLFPYTPVVWLRPKHLDEKPTLRPLCELCPLSESCKEKCKEFFPSLATSAGGNSPPLPSSSSPSNSNS